MLRNINIMHWHPAFWRKETEHTQAIGWIALIITILAGSTFTSFGRQLAASLSPLSLIFVGESSIVFFIAFSFGVMPMIREIRKLKRMHLLPLLVLSVLATGALMLWFLGLQTTEAVNAELFGRAEIPFLLLLAALFLRESVTRAHVLAGIVVGLGVWIVAMRGFAMNFAPRTGDLAIIGGSFTFSIVSIIFKKFLRELPPELVLFVRSSTAVGLFFAISPFVAHPFIEELRSLPLELLPALVGFGFVARFLGVLSFYEAVERLPISTISLVTPTSIVASVLFANLYLGEPVFWYHAVGGGLVLLGALLLQFVGLHPTEENGKRHMKQHHRHHL